MASEDLVEVEGTVLQEGGGGLYFVETEKCGTVQAHLCGKMRSHRIRVVPGDRVTVALTPYDLTKGRITFRHK
jgi:translation initiation factor IF-1